MLLMCPAFQDVSLCDMKHMGSSVKHAAVSVW